MSKIQDEVKKSKNESLKHQKDKSQTIAPELPFSYYKGFGVQVKEISFDYYKGFHDGIQALLKLKKVGE